MENQLINWYTAKLAKKKNCNLFSGNMAEFTMNKFKVVNLSLLQKWLRETHSIHIEIKPIPYNQTEFKWIYDIGKMTIDDIPNLSRRNEYSLICQENYKYFSSYEKALEIGLQKALKLI